MSNEAENVSRSSRSPHDGNNERLGDSADYDPVARVIALCQRELSGRHIEGAQADGDNGPWLAQQVLDLLDARVFPSGLTRDPGESQGLADRAEEVQILRGMRDDADDATVIASAEGRTS